MRRLEIVVPGAQALAPGEARRFCFRRGRHVVEGFVLRTPERLVAYANECPHWNVDLDLGDGQFWDPDTGRILCKNHGALFHPETGVCEVGPCVGLALEAFPVQLDAESADVRVTVPDASPMDSADP